MYRILPYGILFAATALLQIFLFNQLSVSIYLCPLVYVAFVLLLPLELPHALVLLGGLASGAVMAWTMGTAGINTAATVLLAFLRPHVLRLLCRRDDAREEGVPSVERLGKAVFLNYLAVLVLIHHALFFALESLSGQYLLQTILRTIVSGTATVGFCWLIARLFTSKLSVRI